MSFLQPYLLWGLPLALLPVLIHLFNRMRHRSRPWAATMFLLEANRKSTRYARLRQLLILLLRCLAIAALVLALSRPLSGGWLGWMFSPAPEVILVLLDRSASMETRSGDGLQSKRESALKLIVQATRQFAEKSRIVLVDSALRSPQEIASPALLPEISLTTPTDTAADVPAMLQSALDWLTQNRPGSAEIWIASDLQRGNWQPESDRWPALSTTLAALPQRVRMRLLALNRESQANTSIAVLEALRLQRADQTELDLVLEIQRPKSDPAPLPLSVVIDGNRAPLEVTMEGTSFQLRHKIPLGTRQTGGWGKVELPADDNPRDNVSYFVYGPPTALRAAVISADAQSRRVLHLAAAPAPKELHQSSEAIEPAQVDSVNLQDFALALWQSPLPSRQQAQRLQSFVEKGGTLIFFPLAETNAQTFLGTSWGAVQTAPADKPFRVTRWEKLEGPLANTEEGLELPLSELTVTRRQIVLGEKNALAAFDDGAPFLTRRVLGKGQMFVCATLPQADWSNLQEGTVLVPMLQRLFQIGGRQFTQANSVECGSGFDREDAGRWVCVDEATPKDVRTQAGIYRNGGRLVAVNRPAREDDRDLLEAARIRQLFGTMPVQMFEEQRGRTGSLQAELWRLLLIGMAAFLLLEAVLILPERQPAGEPDKLTGNIPSLL